MSSSSSDSEDERLKAALDPTMVALDLYSDKPKQNGEEKKKTLKKSLRRDKQIEGDHTRAVMSELNVTPEFQNYVAKHLDIVMSKSIKETKGKKSKVTDEPKEESMEVDGEEEGHIGLEENQVIVGIRLLKRSAQPVNMKVAPPIILKRPNLLKHRSIPDTEDLSKEELSSITVTTEQILAKEGTEYYANRFASRVEEGEIKTKKKKKKKAKPEGEELKPVPTITTPKEKKSRSKKSRMKRKREEENKLKSEENGIAEESNHKSSLIDEDKS